MRFLGPRGNLLGWPPGILQGGAPRLSPGVLAVPPPACLPPRPPGGAQGLILPQTERFLLEGPPQS